MPKRKRSVPGAPSKGRERIRRRPEVPEEARLPETSQEALIPPPRDNSDGSNYAPPIGPTRGPTENSEGRTQSEAVNAFSIRVESNLERAMNDTQTVLRDYLIRALPRQGTSREVSPLTIQYHIDTIPCPNRN